MDAPSLGAGTVLACAIVFGGLIVVAPGLGILFAVCGIPLLLAIRGHHGAMGCLTSGLIALGILLATIVAFFFTCTAIYESRGRGNDMLGDDTSATIALVVAGVVFAGLTYLSVRARRSTERKGAFAEPIPYHPPAPPDRKRPDDREAP